jgi:hypothetical protein
VLTRAYADWSSPVNALYRSQLVARAVDLVQLFPAAAYAKNGADIRLAVDTVEDMFRLPDLTHVVIVAGDSDYVPLAQRCKRLGRVVVGVGVAGSTAKSLAAACDQFDSYDSLPGVTPDPAPQKKADAAAPAAASSAPAQEDRGPDGGAAASRTAPRAERTDDEWVHLSAVKNLLKRMDPSFSEKALGHRSFSDFAKAYPAVADIDESTNIVRVRLHSTETASD